MPKIGLVPVCFSLFVMHLCPSFLFGHKQPINIYFFNFEFICEIVLFRVMRVPSYDASFIRVILRRKTGCMLLLVKCYDIKKV